MSSGDIRLAVPRLASSAWPTVVGMDRTVSEVPNHRRGAATGTAMSEDVVNLDRITDLMSTTLIWADELEDAVWQAYRPHGWPMDPSKFAHELMVALGIRIVERP